MAIEDRITRVLEQAEAEGELGVELRQRIQVAVKQAFAIERTRLRSEKVVAMSEEDAVRYRIISELSTDWVYAARREDEHGKVNIEWATEAFERITGSSEAEIARGPYHGLGGEAVRGEKVRLVLGSARFAPSTPSAADTG